MILFNVPFHSEAQRLSFKVNTILQDLTLSYFGQDKHFCQRIIVSVFLQIYSDICLGTQKNRLIETVLLSTHNIGFG